MSQQQKFIANQLEYYLLLTDVDEQDREIVARYANIVDNYELLFQRNILSDIERLVLPDVEKKGRVRVWD